MLGVSEGATYALGEVPVADCSTTDALSGVATTATAAVSGGTANGVGGFTATCSGASDVAENVTPPVSAGYIVGYVFVGFLPPMNTGPSGGVFNAGRTIPLKWRLMDASGTAISAVSAVSSLQIAPNPSCASGGEGAPVTTLYPGNAELLLESPTYHVNWDTTGLATGCYSVMLALDDTSVMTSIVPLR